ncbi:MAG: DnaJ domain-containing protein, partial [Planctomycetales bacterium]|nr:DnaJ domain-containing protein [Planctomycetales bacterium]NIM08816.1 DnaJ domain-containing protein [Planctomycetales bacterium]NIN08275.1 DnaJ domain-containing protein [Planctomycetales bacterium]NIN77404.1 DnaJ domain-containing protein [Planctomycetales bacterium]NIO34581.1 DnaJ domain-containing protein [Planctomycetales bacterium]
MAIAKRDYYEVLGVPHDADTEAIKTAYRKLALKYHPDRNKDAGATQHFKEITEAFAVLSDPQKRTRYDAHGHAGIAGFTPEDLFGEIDFGDLFGRHGLDFGGGLLDGLFGRRRRDALRGADIEVSLTISLEKVLKGGQETVHFSRPTACQACSATGAQPGTTPKSCDACQGTGRQVASRTDQGVSFQQITPCRTCHGRGVVIEQPCGECGGQAVVHRAETLSVK